MKEFTNKFLVAMPHLIDPNFAKTLVYIFEHSEEGSMGVIINKSIPRVTADDILEQTRLDQLKPLPKIYFGGPMGLNQGLFLHSPDYKIEGTFEMPGNIHLTSNPLIIDDILGGTGPTDFRCTFGYAGWGPAQLDREFENSDWLIMPADLQTIFKSPDSQKWENAARHFGISMQDITGPAGFA